MPESAREERGQAAAQTKAGCMRIIQHNDKGPFSRPHLRRRSSRAWGARPRRSSRSEARSRRSSSSIGAPPVRLLPAPSSAGSTSSGSPGRGQVRQGSSQATLPSRGSVGRCTARALRPRALASACAGFYCGRGMLGQSWPATILAEPSIGTRMPSLASDTICRGWSGLSGGEGRKLSCGNRDAATRHAWAARNPCSRETATIGFAGAGLSYGTRSSHRALRRRPAQVLA